MLWILLIYYLRNEYNSLATKAANGKRCNHDKEKASQIKFMSRVILAPNDLLTPFALRAQNFRVNVEFSTEHRGRIFFFENVRKLPFSSSYNPSYETMTRKWTRSFWSSGQRWTDMDTSSDMNSCPSPCPKQTRTRTQDFLGVGTRTRRRTWTESWLRTRVSAHLCL